MTFGNAIRPGFNFIESEEIQLPEIGKVVLTGDVGCTGFSEDSKRVFEQILRMEADSFLILGDLTFSGSEEEFYKVINFCNTRVYVPVFALSGNHDLPNYGIFFGLSTYALILERFVLIFLDNSTGYFSDHDLVFLEKELQKFRGKDFVIFMHVPPPTDISRNHLLPAEWEKLRKVLDRHRESIRNIFCAHIHGYHEYFLDGYPVMISAGGGAAMIYDLKKPEQKIHNAVVLTLSNNISTELMKIK
jgi:3',5'-cyclic AMP phosphodiesterase CpdA